MRKVSAVLVIALLGLFATVPTAEANILPGFVMFIWHGVAAPAPPNVNIFVFGAGGAYCGTAVIPGVGPAVNATLAAQSNFENVHVPPITFGVYFTTAPVPPNPLLCGFTFSPLISYWHTP